MAIFDTLISGGTLVTPSGLAAADLGIREGRIVAWLAPGSEFDAAEHIDATGYYVLPGLVDAHVHFREPGPVHKEGFRRGSMAAAAGGVTTVMVMPTDDPLTLTAEGFAAKRRLAEGQIHVDVALQAAAVDSVGISALADAGAASFEIFLGDIPPALLMPDAGCLQRVLDAIGEAGAVAGITPADDGVIAAAVTAAQAAPKSDRLAFFRSRPPLSEAVGIARAAAVARMTGTRVHLRQISCRASLEILAAARAVNSSLSAEVTPHNLLLTEDEITRQGPYAKVLPPLRTSDDVEAMWMGLQAGAIDIVATDHAPHTPAEKRAGMEDIWKAPGGFPGVQTLLPLLMAAVADGRIGWPDLVRHASERPARLFGFHPRKGHLGIGADADLVLVDPNRPMTIANEEQLSGAAITPFAGWNAPAKPVRTLLRGRTVMCDGRIEGPPSGAVVAPART